MDFFELFILFTNQRVILLLLSLNSTCHISYCFGLTSKYFGEITLWLAFSSKMSFLWFNLLRFPIRETLNLIKSFHKVCIFFNFTFALAYVDVAPENKSTTTTAASIPPKCLHSLSISPVTIPTMPDVFVARNIWEAEWAGLVSTKS